MTLVGALLAGSPLCLALDPRIKMNRKADMSKEELQNEKNVSDDAGASVQSVTRQMRMTIRS